MRGQSVGPDGSGAKCGVHGGGARWEWGQMGCKGLGQMGAGAR